MRLRQIALATHDIRRARDDVATILQLGEDFLDPIVGDRHGLTNAVWPIGDTFLEVVSPHRPGTAAGRFLDTRGGDGGYMVIVQVDDIAVGRARVSAAGVRVVAEDSRDGATFLHLHPKDVGGAILSIDVMDPPEDWAWGGPGWRQNVRTSSALAIVGVELLAADPAAMAAQWGAVLGVRPEAAEAVVTLPLTGGEVRFADATGRREGLAFDVRVRDPAGVIARAADCGCLQDGEVRICGTRVNLLSA